MAILTHTQQSLPSFNQMAVYREMRALHWAAWIGNLFFVQELISRYHVDINARENNGSTALGEARRENYSANVKKNLIQCFS